MARLRLPRAVLNLLGGDPEEVVIAGEAGQTADPLTVKPRADRGSYVIVGDDGNGWIDIYEEVEDAKVHMTDADGGQAVLSTSSGLQMQPTDSGSTAISAGASAPKNAGVRWLDLNVFGGGHFRIDHLFRIWLTSAGSTPPDINSIATGEAAIWFDATAGACKIRVSAKDANGNLRTGEIALT